MLELVLHAEKIGMPFQGVEVILCDQPVIQFSSKSLKNAFDALSKENGLMQPYKTSAALNSALRSMLKNSNWIYEGEIKRTASSRIYRVIKQSDHSLRTDQK